MTIKNIHRPCIPLNTDSRSVLSQPRAGHYITVTPEHDQTGLWVSLPESCVPKKHLQVTRLSVAGACWLARLEGSGSLAPHEAAPEPQVSSRLMLRVAWGGPGRCPPDKLQRPPVEGQGSETQGHGVKSPGSCLRSSP